jgi:hypothetical protein
MADLDKEIQRLSNLRQYKDKDRIVVERQAQLNIWKKDANLDSRFVQDEDKEIANNIFNTYIENHNINSYNDIQNLVDLVYEEVMVQRIQKDIDKILSDKTNKFIPDKQIVSLHSVQERIWVLKEKIGIVKKDTKDDLTALQELEKKMDLYIHFNRNEFTIYAPFKCTDCGKEDVEPLLLRRRVKNFDILKHPFFSGRFWFNARGIELVEQGVWTKEQYAHVFYTSVSYVDWVISNKHKIIDLPNIESEKVEEFIKENPYLGNIKEIDNEK